MAQVRPRSTRETSAPARGEGRRAGGRSAAAAGVAAAVPSLLPLSAHSAPGKSYSFTLDRIFLDIAITLVRSQTGTGLAKPFRISDQAEIVAQWSFGVKGAIAETPTCCQSALHEGRSGRQMRP